MVKVQLRLLYRGYLELCWTAAGIYRPVSHQSEFEEIAAGTGLWRQKPRKAERGNLATYRGDIMSAIVTELGPKLVHDCDHFPSKRVPCMQGCLHILPKR